MMEQILEEVKLHDIARIRQKLTEFGIKVGPITPSTKSLFEKRLARKIFESRGGKEDSRDDNIDKADDIKKHAVTTLPTEQNMPNSVDVYYGICLPEDLDLILAKEATQLVFTDKVQAMRMAKKLKGSRFKVFKNQEEADHFSKLTSESAFQSPRKPQKDTPEEKPQASTESSPFKAPKPQDFVVVRLAIERGDVKTFEDFIWSNPRYLVSSGDTPAIYQEGSRYTAMHVAAMKNKPEICRLILVVLEDPQFLTELYSMSKTTEEAINTRISFLVDLYLNMPDKGNCESPLHMACKFGHEKVVEILAAHPNTDRFLKNKWGDSPKDVICTRCPHAPAATRERIAELLQGQCYVPLIRSEDNSTQPLIGQPWSPDITSSPLNITKPVQSPCDPTVCVRACAGPMSPSNADLFHKRWTTPPSRSKTPVQAKKYLDTKRSDSEKGLERIGRHLAHDMDVPWLEYWTFLDAYVDLSTQKGLDVLDEYFRKSLWVTFFKDYIEKYGAFDTGHDTINLCTPVKTRNKEHRNETTESSVKENVFTRTPSSAVKKLESDDDVKCASDSCVDKSKTSNSQSDSEETNNDQSPPQPIVSPMTSLSQKFTELSVLDRSWSDKATINTSHGSELSVLDGSVLTSSVDADNSGTSSVSDTGDESQQLAAVKTESVAGNGESVAGNSESVAGNCEPVAGNGESLAGNGESVAGNGESVAGNGEPVAGNSESVAGNCEPVAGNGESVAGNCESVAGNGESVAGNGESVAGNGESVVGNGEENSEYFDSVSELAPDKVALAPLQINGDNFSGLDDGPVLHDGQTNDTDVALCVNVDHIKRQLSERSDSTSSYKTADEDPVDERDEDLSLPCSVEVYIKLKDDCVLKKLEQLSSLERSVTTTSVQLLVRLHPSTVTRGLQVDIIVIPAVESVSQAVTLYETVEIASCDGDMRGLTEGSIMYVGGLDEQGQDIKVPAYFTRALPKQKVAYIYGALPCREDLDVSRALGDVFISPEHHPNVFHWKINLCRFTSDTKYRWQSPAMLKPKFASPSPRASPARRPSPGVPYGSPVHVFGQGRNSTTAGIRTRLQFSAIQEL